MSTISVQRLLRQKIPRDANALAQCLNILLLGQESAMAPIIDEYNYWSHAAEPVGEFDSELLATMERTRAEFFQRGREGQFADKPART